MVRAVIKLSSSTTIVITNATATCSPAMRKKLTHKSSKVDENLMN